VYKHTRPTEKKIPLPTASLSKSSAHISVFLHRAMSHQGSCCILLWRAKTVKSRSLCGKAFIVLIMANSQAEKCSVVVPKDTVIFLRPRFTALTPWYPKSRLP